MNYIQMIKDCEDFRVANREAFKMEQVYQFNMEKFIHYYEYNEGDEKSDDEYSDQEEEQLANKGYCFSDKLVQAEDPTAESENNPFGSGSINSFP